MEEDQFSKQLGKLKLTEEEEGKVVDAEDNDIDESDEVLENASACKILTNKIINVKVVKTLMPKICNLWKEISTFELAEPMKILEPILATRKLRPWYALSQKGHIDVVIKDQGWMVAVYEIIWKPKDESMADSCGISYNF
ncbi:hypothetical protein SDJN03_14218, partial [Cucurbita argyrosperma subsp. sororia]